MSMTSDDTLARLAAVIESRKGGDPDRSYVARLFAKGQDAILKKIGEEATETVMAAKDGERSRIVAEMADLWFHSMVALAAFGLKPADVLAELEPRKLLATRLHVAGPRYVGVGVREAFFAATDGRG